MHNTLQPSVGNTSSFRMIDIGEKKETHRRAVASGIFKAKPETIEKIILKSLPKGDVLQLSEIAGIQGAKLTSTLLPLCHPLPLTSVRVWTKARPDQIQVYCEAKTYGKTGVEMEALCGANAALLCLYDLTKGVDPVLEIGQVQLEIKEGGKSGFWMNPNSNFVEQKNDSTQLLQQKLHNMTAKVLVLSDTCYAQPTADQSGAKITEWLKSRGATVGASSILPDDKKQLKESLHKILQTKSTQILITSGGTGISERDITPEVMREICYEYSGKEIIGLGELMRKNTAQYNKNAWLSRASVFAAQGLLMITLPGNPKAVEECLNEIVDFIPHCLHVMGGGKHL